MKKCSTCGHEGFYDGVTLHTLHDDKGHILVIRNVPAMICEQCEAPIFELDVADRTGKQFAAWVKAGGKEGFLDYGEMPATSSRR